MSFNRWGGVRCVGVLLYLVSPPRSRSGSVSLTCPHQMTEQIKNRQGLGVLGTSQLSQHMPDPH